MADTTLQERMEEVEDKIVDYERHPFTYLGLEMNLARRQVDAILNLMDDAHRSLSSSSPMGHYDFEQRVYQIVPERKSKQRPKLGEFSGSAISSNQMTVISKSDDSAV